MEGEKGSDTQRNYTRRTRQTEAATRATGLPFTASEATDTSAAGADPCSAVSRTPLIILAHWTTSSIRAGTMCGLLNLSQLSASKPCQRTVFPD